MKFKLIFISIVVFPIFLWGQEAHYTNLSPYTQSLLEASEQFKKGSIDKAQFCKSFAIDDSNEKMQINAFIEFAGTIVPSELEQLGVYLNAVFGDIATVRMPVEALEQLASLPQIKRIQVGTPVETAMDQARLATNVADVQSGVGLPHMFRGKNVVIGIVDGGFEFGHTNFFDVRKNELRIKRVWNQNDAKGGPPEGFSYGTEYKTESEIVSARFDNRGDTHGTHVTGIAAGSDTTSLYYGVAPESDIVLVSFDRKWASNAVITDGIKYIFDYAASVGKPCVINLSLGSYIGPRDGTSTFDLICDKLQGPGKLLVGAAGNEGNRSLHISKSISQTDTLKTFISGTSNVDLWGEKGKSYKLSLVTYSNATKKIIYESEAVDVSGAGQKVFNLSEEKNGYAGKITVSTERNPNNEKANAFLKSNIYYIPEGNCLGVKIWGEDGMIHAWGDGWTTFRANSVESWSDADNDYSIGEIGGTGKRLISVGSYITRNEYVNVLGEVIKKEMEIGALSAFSSKGPTSDSRMKPEITAPGDIIVSSFSSALATLESQKPSVIFENPVGFTKYYYGQMSGTSMAAPHVAGILATWLEANPSLTPEDVRSVLEKTAIKDSRTSETPGNAWGYGKIDAWKGLKEVIRLSETTIRAETLLSDKMYKTFERGVFNIGFITADSRVNISVFSMSGQNVYNCFLGDVSAFTERTVDLQSLEKGLYIIKVKGDRRLCKYRIVID